METQIFHHAKKYYNLSKKSSKKETQNPSKILLL
jgi:hypothetical protein